MRQCAKELATSAQPADKECHCLKVGAVLTQFFDGDAHWGTRHGQDKAWIYQLRTVYNHEWSLGSNPTMKHIVDEKLVVFLQSLIDAKIIL